MHVGPIVSSDVFYNPDGGQYQRWSSRGVLAVEMEAAMLFTSRRSAGSEGAGRPGGLPPHRQRHRRRGRVQADHRRRAARGGRPDDARRARDRHVRLATASSSSSTRRRATARPGKRWPELAPPRRRARAERRRRALRASRPPRCRRHGEAPATAARRRRRRRDDERGRERRSRGRAPRSPSSRSAPARTSGARTGSRPSFDDAVRVALDGESRDDRRRPRRARGAARARYFANVGSRGMSGAVARRANTMSKRARRQGDVLLRADARVPRVAEHRGDRPSSTTASGARARCTT